MHLAEAGTEVASEPASESAPKPVSRAAYANVFIFVISVMSWRGNEHNPRSRLDCATIENVDVAGCDRFHIAANFFELMNQRLTLRLMVRCAGPDDASRRSCRGSRANGELTRPRPPPRAPRGR